MSHVPEPPGRHEAPVIVVQAPRQSPAVLALLLAAIAVVALAALGLFSSHSSTNPAAAGSANALAPAAAQVAGAAAAPAQAQQVSAVTAAQKPAAAAAPAADPSAVSVMIQNYAFSPATLTVPVGTTVTWTNMDTAPHTVTASSGPDKLNSPQLSTGQSWSYTFTKAGTDSYYCAVHPDMKASVTVTAAAASTAPTTAPTTAPSSAAPTAAPASSAPATAAPTGAEASPSMDMGSGASDGSCTDLADAVVQPFVVHVDHGHLEESPGQQVSDILNLDQYVKTHTVLVENMTSWDQEIAPALTSTISAFVVHVQHGHLEESPGQQAQDILNTDQYVKTHTVLVENMTTPWTNIVDGTC